jgi:probable addiction module antidote protein
MSRKLKSAVSRSHEEATVESFRKDPAFAAEYLNAVLEDGDQEELMLALRRMSEAFGGVQKLAGRAKLNANTLYRTLSPKGNPELKSLRAVLRAMGMQLTVRPLRKRVAWPRLQRQLSAWVTLALKPVSLTKRWTWLDVTV